MNEANKKEPLSGARTSIFTLKEPRLGLFRYRRDEGLHGTQCLTSLCHQLYNAVTLFMASLPYPKWHTSIHTRCSCGCVANKTCVMLTKKAGTKSHLGHIQKQNCRQHTTFTKPCLFLQVAKVKEVFVFLSSVILFLSTMRRAVSRDSHQYSHLILVWQSLTKPSSTLKL